MAALGRRRARTTTRPRSASWRRRRRKESKETPGRTDGRTRNEGVEGQKVYSIADGYISRIKVSTWGYGKALYITHPDGNTSVYAHLQKFAEAINDYVIVNQYKKENFEIQLFPPKDKFVVKRGEVIALSGNTGSSAGAHLHFEINVALNRNFAKWFRDVYRSDSNSHGEWHGWNLLGLDPEAIFLEQRKQGEAFSILKFVQSRVELCRVLVRQTDFPWIQEYAPLVDSPGQPDEEVAGYELVLNFNGVPTRAIPHSAMTVGEGPIYELLSVNNTERQAQRCGKLVIKKGARWEFTALGRRTLDILLFTP